jgi:hypothetical protein
MVFFSFWLQYTYIKYCYVTELKVPSQDEKMECKESDEKYDDVTKDPEELELVGLANATLRN